MIFEQPLPVSRIQSVSPSRYTGLKACLLREAISAANAKPLLPSTPAAAMGRVAHKLLEEAAKGLAGPERKDIQSRWTALIKQEEGKLLESLIASYQVPLNKSCADFYTREALTLRAAIKAYSPQRMHSEGHGVAPQTGAELYFKTPDALLAGKLDKVDSTQEGIVIRDYKTGAIGEDGEAGAVKPEYLAQMKLYAAIYAECTGRWPIRAEIIPFSGAPVIVNIAPADCQAIAAKARQLLAACNQIIEKIEKSELPISTAAAPSPNHCRFCAYRPGCKAYHDERMKTGTEEYWPSDIWGTVESVSVGAENKDIVVLQMLGSGNMVARRMSRERYPGFPQIAKGMGIAIYGLRKENAPGVFKEGPATAIYFSGAAGYNGSL